MATPLTEEEKLRRRVPAAPPVVRPAAAQLALPPPPGATPTNVVRPGLPTIAVDSAGRAGIGGIPATPVQQPAYRTPTGFVQTPTPINPAVPRPAAAAMGATPAAAPVAGVKPARVPGKMSGLGTLGLVVEAANVAGAGIDGGVPAAAQEAAGSVGRLGAAAAGAKLGGMLPGRFAAPGAAVGGVAGYIGGSKAVSAVENALSTGPQGQGALRDAFAARRADENRAAGIMPGGGGMSMVDTGAATANAQARRDVANKAPLFNPTVEELTAIGATRPTAAQAMAAPGQPVPVSPTGQPMNVSATVDSTEAAATGAAGREVAGTFNGRTIYRDEVDALAGQLNGGTGNGLVNGNPTGVAAPGTAASQLASPPRITGGAQGAVIGDQNDLSNYAKQLDKQITDLGPLNMRSKRDLVGQLLGLKGRALSGRDDNAAAASRNAADLQQRSAAEQLRADVDREQIAASEKTQRKARTQTITDAEGNVFSLDDGTAQPVTTADGKQVNAGKTTKPDNTQAKLAADLLAQILPLDATPEETKAAVAQAQQTAAALMGQGGAQSTNAAPADEASFLAAARAANPGATEAELKAYYKTTYGK